MTSWQKYAPPSSYDLGRHRAHLERLDEIENVILPKFIIGKRHLENCRKINLGIIADGQAMPAIRYKNGNMDPYMPGAGNVFAWGVPGVGKTMIGKIFSGVYGLPFQRIQLTSDLLPADLIGSRVFDQEKNRYEIKYGPLAKGRFILADELSRATEKTQSALLEVMESWTITIWDTAYRIDPGRQMFFVFATGNPVEVGGTFRLGEALVDRFAQFLLFNYLDDPDEMANLLKISEKYSDPASAVEPVMFEEELVELRAFRRNNVDFSDAAVDYITRIMLMMRDPSKEEIFLSELNGYDKREFTQVIALGGSDRAMEAFFGHLAKAHAFRRGEWRVDPEDAKAVAVDCLSHRLMLTREGGSLRRANYPYMREFEFQQLIMRSILDHVPIFSGKKR